ncbi:hypothetical protein HYH03_010999 [Edaphochlamys debaryana]|uniref:DM10 domain-containing protein n=1 Tax=Edaphochlamys debaryana TaxID=47281 RepID=A0A835XSX1_9CHLO|nr:hypothetical protein HYH03_010999 [Edaphochlamys debaryana]|eukprot:KAG2490607.1 hypothetical protein HYH03_010999 [Edaphochlamys debaryana]
MPWKPKVQTLRYINNYPIVEDVAVPMDPFNRAYKFGGRIQDVGPVPPFATHDLSKEPPPKPQPPQRELFQEPGSTGRPGQGRVPNWVKYDKQVLRFMGFFREEVLHSPLESWRVRKVAVRYYLENDMVEIVEIQEKNSGLPQGTLLKRHCAVKEDGSPLRWPDLRIGSEVVLYKRGYVLLSCDAFTRGFYGEQGQPQPEDEPPPRDGQYDKMRKAMDASRAKPPTYRAPTRGSPKRTLSAPGGGPPLPADADDDPYASPRGPSAMFEICPVKPPPEILARDNAVLRFMCAWDNTAVTFGEVLAFALFYHVADGTIEIREVAHRNSGRDPFPLLLSRCRLPKTVPPVFGRPLSPRSRRALNLEYYDWRDLFVGAKVNVYGRPLLVYDADDGTKDWLKQHVPGITDKQVTAIEVDFDPNGPKRPPLSIPPHTSGFGSEEDSLQNVLHLVPKPPQRHYADYLENWNKVLRFEASMVPLGPGRPLVGPHDAERRFIISYHLLDKTMSIWEPKRDNSGMEHGTFLERTKVRNPATGAPYADTDLRVGAKLEVFGRGFQLLDADTYTLRYMEKECPRFAWADFDKVLGKLAAWLAMYPEGLPDRLRSDLLAADPQGTTYINKFALHKLLAALGSDLNPHEVITLVRALGADRQGLLAEQLLVALGLAPPPPPPPPPKEEAPPPPEPLPNVPFPAPGLRAAAAATHQSYPPPPQQRQQPQAQPQAPALSQPPPQRPAAAWQAQPQEPVQGQGQAQRAAQQPWQPQPQGQGQQHQPGQVQPPQWPAAPWLPQEPQPAAHHQPQAQPQQHQQERHVAWGPHPNTVTPPLSGAAAALAPDASRPASAAPSSRPASSGMGPGYGEYRGPGPVPGHPRVDPPAQPYQHREYGNKFGAYGPPGWQQQQQEQQQAPQVQQHEDDRRSGRDTSSKLVEAWSGASSVAGSASSKQREMAGSVTFRPVSQPGSLWQTTNMSVGGVGHSGSFKTQR